MTAQRLEEVDAATVKAWLDRGEAVLIDVREIGEHAREHIAGARLVPLSTFDAANANFPNSGKIVLHCASGIRSAKAGEKLVASGKTGVAHLKGGLPAWKSAGFPTEFNAKAPLSLPRQMQIIAGSLIVLGVVFGAAVSPWFNALAGFVGAGLAFSGATGWCGMTTLLTKLPYNRPKTA